LEGRSSAYVYVGLAAVIWGSNGVIVNLVNLTPLTITFFRVLFGGIALLAGVLLMGKLSVLRAGGSLRQLIILGALQAVGWFLLFQAMKLIPIGSAVLLNYTAPIFVALLAPLTLKERIQKKTITALTLSIIGVVLICYRGLQAQDISMLGAATGLAAGFAYGVFIIYSKRVLGRVSSFTAALYSYLTAAVLLAPTLMWARLSLDAVSWVLLLLMGVVNTGFAVTLYFTGLSRLRAQEAAVLTYLEPVSAIIFGYLVLAQQPTTHMLVGGALILSAQYILVSRSRSNL